MSKLEFLVGDWNGVGMLGGKEGQVSQKGPWKVERAFGEDFLRIEFDASLDEGKAGRNRFVAYFTFDPEQKHYRTVWMNIDNYFQFRETGDFNEAGDTLTLISEQPKKDGTKVRVRSVFRRIDADHVTVEDHPLDEKGNPGPKSFGFELERVKR